MYLAFACCCFFQLFLVSRTKFLTKAKLMHYFDLISLGVCEKWPVGCLTFLAMYRLRGLGVSNLLSDSAKIMSDTTDNGEFFW